MKRILLAITLLSASIAHAECAKSKEPCPGQAYTPPSKADIQQQMNEMGPVFGNMASSMLQARLSALADPKTTEQLARFSRNYFNALVTQGFTEEQALKIVTAVGVPTSQ
ncbi:MAG: hypothetical protein K0S16_1158 [Moraxellaceae bacterium]|jgi:hypothetical protein|nr:hypothetical protein [Moraxellaceae bacterium]